MPAVLKILGIDAVDEVAKLIENLFFLAVDREGIVGDHGILTDLVEEHLCRENRGPRSSRECNSI